MIAAQALQGRIALVTGGTTGIGFGSAKSHRIAENFDVFDFSLSAQEIAAIDALDTGVRGGPDPDSLDLKTYGFTIPD